MHCDDIADLWVGNEQTEIKIPQDKPFYLGRSADFPLGVHDRSVSRKMIRIQLNQDNEWLVTNISGKRPVKVTDPAKNWITSLKKDESLTIRWEYCLICVRGEIEDHWAEISLENKAQNSALSLEGTATLDPEPLSDEYRLVVAALAENIFKSGNYGDIRKNSEAMRRLGWQESPKKFDRILDRLAREMAVRGVEGVVGSNSQLASGRRIAIVQYCLSVGLVKLEDIRLVDAEAKKNS